MHSSNNGVRRHPKAKPKKMSYQLYLRSALLSGKNDDPKKKEKKLLPESACSRVERSWDLLKERAEAVGMDFLLRLFDECPDLLTLFPFAGSLNLENDQHLDPQKKKLVLRQKLKASEAVRAHARLAMGAVGRCVAGLNDVEGLLFTLRSLGCLHRDAGVENQHYEVFFRLLLATIGHALGPEEWTHETEEAWTLVGTSVASAMRKPTTEMEDTEPPKGWGAVMVVASTYEAVVGPFWLAGFTRSLGNADNLLTLFDLVAMVCFAIDLAIGWVSTQPGGNMLLYKIGIEEWVAGSRPVLDAVILASVISLQCLTWFTSSSPSAVGVPCTHALGLLPRVAAGLRILHAIRGVQNALILKCCAGDNESGRDNKDNAHAGQRVRSNLRIVKIVLTLAYVTHLSACLWCIIERMQITSEPIQPSPFFPDTSILLGTNGVLNGYAKSIHWAWVNLAGIGNSDSTPVSTLECVFILLVHFIGATLYAVVTGNVVSILEEITSREDEVGRDLADLSDFMRTCGHPVKAHKRIVQGYVLRNMIAGGNYTEDGEVGQDNNEGFPAFPHVAASKLPGHLQKELALYARAEAFRRRDRAFRSCSSNFLLAIAGALKSTVTLLPGDFLVEQGKPVPRQFFLLERGTISVVSHGRSVRILRRGDVLGKRWLIRASTPDTTKNNEIQFNQDETQEIASRDDDNTNATENRAVNPLANKALNTSAEENRRDNVQENGSSHKEQSHSEWLFLGSDIAGASLRAMEQCTLVAGLTLCDEVRKLSHRFPADMQMLKSEMARANALTRNIQTSQGVTRAVLAFKRGIREKRNEKVMKTA